MAAGLLPPEPYEHDTFTLEGHELRIIEQGRTDSPDSTSLYVPSIGLIVAGDVVYNQCRMYVGDTTPESRKNWIAALDRLAALNPAIVVAGHKKPGAPDSPSTIQDTSRYLQDFDRLQKTATSDQELFDRMTELYPHWVANQSWLMLGFPGRETVHYRWCECCRVRSYSAGRMKQQGSRPLSQAPNAIVIDEVPCPTPKEGELTVRVAAAGVGPWDALLRQGKSVVQPSLPIISRVGFGRECRGRRTRGN